MITTLLLLAGTQVIELNGMDDFARGSFDGTALASDGTVVAAPRWTATGELPGPALRALSDGSTLISNPLRLISARGEELLKDKARNYGDACVSGSSTYVAAMPGGLLRRRDRNGWSTIALPRSHRSLWALSCSTSGVVVAAGEPSALYRIEGERIVASTKVPGPSLRAVTQHRGLVYAGGQTDGRVWRWDGKALRVAMVARYPEVRRLVVHDEDLFVLSVSASSGEESSMPAPTPLSRGSGAVDRLKAPEQRLEPLWSSESETAMDMVWHRKALYVGTDAGQLYTIAVDDSVADAKRRHRRTGVVDERAIEALDGHGKTLSLLGGGHRRSATTGAHTYTSPRLQAGGLMATWGSLRADGSKLEGLQWRFGNTADGSGWGPWQSEPGGRSTHAQVRVTIGAKARLSRLMVFVAPDNFPPMVTAVKVLLPGAHLEPKPEDVEWDRSVELPGADFKVFEGQGEAPKHRARVSWRSGRRGITWEASDPEGDPLIYALSLKRGDTVVRRWQQTEPYISIETADLRHGHYRIEVAVRDGQSPWSQPVPSAPFQVDHRPPSLRQIGHNPLTLRAEDDDRVLGVVCGAGVDRVELLPSDGLADSGVETFRLPKRGWTGALKLRRCEAIDPSGNRQGLDLKTP